MARHAALLSVIGASIYWEQVSCMLSGGFKRREEKKDALESTGMYRM